MAELTSLPNIGAKLEAQLLAVGIDSIEQFKTLGSREAWLRILDIDSSAWATRLAALEGAVLGIRSKDLSDDSKIALRQFVSEAKKLRKAAKNQAKAT